MPKVLVPVFPSDRFYDAVVRAGDLVAAEGGLITFVFTIVRPPPETYAADVDGRPGELDLAVEAGDFDARDLEEWRARQVAALEEARQLLYEREVRDDQIDYLFADDADSEGAAQAIADEAAAGAYDCVVLSRGYFENEVMEEESTPAEVAEAIKQVEGVRLVVT